MAKKELISEMIYNKLRMEIITGKLKSGHRLVELEVAKEYQASQVPVREALLRLEEQGLLRIIKHTGTFVSDITFEEMKEFFEQRSLIEKYAITKAMFTMQDKEKTRLREIYEEMVQAAERGDLLELIEKDMAFHQWLIECSGRRISLQIWRLLDGQIRRFLMITHPKFFRNLKEVALTHEAILHAVLDNDTDLAERLIQEHIHLVWNKINTIESP